MNIKLTSIPVNDPNEAIKFYRDVLGFQVLMHVPEAFLAIVVSPEQPEGTGLLLEPNANPISKTYQTAVYEQKLPIIVLGSEDVQKEYERLKAKGVVFIQEPTTNEHGTQAVFDDTCGNYIQIHQS